MKARVNSQLKRLFATAMTAVLVATLSLAFAACNNSDYTAQAGYGEYVSVTVTVGEKVFHELTKRANLHDLFLDMEGQSEIADYGYDEYEGDYYINAFDTLKDGGGKIVVVYHDLKDETLYVQNRFKKIDDVNYRSSAGMAISKIPVSSDAHYYIALEDNVQ